jgi:hypothetical protein
MKVQFLWFQGCPSHESARALLAEALADAGLPWNFEDLDATDPNVAAGLRFPGSPTIRIDGIDIEPGFTDPGDYTPRCRLYATGAGLRGVPPREWIETAIRRGSQR